MSLILTRLEWQPDSEISDSPIIFDDVESINVHRESKSKASSATIVLKNYMDKIETGFSFPLGKYVTSGNLIKFNEGDSVKIYLASTDTVRDIDSTTTSSDLIMTGEIAEVNGKLSDSGAKVTLKLVDKTWTILNRLHTFNYKLALGKTSPTAIQDVVQKVTDETTFVTTAFNTNGDLVGKGEARYLVDARLDTQTNSDGEAGFIETTRQNSTAFPKINLAKIYKSAYEFIDEFSTIDKTNNFDGRDTGLATDNADVPVQNRNMVFFIDERNKFHWYYPNDTVGSGLTFTEGDDSTGNKIISANLTKKTFDIVNYVIFNCGQDLFGNGITDYLYDKNSKAKEFKQIYKPYTEIAKDLIAAEIQEGNLILDNSQTDFTYGGNFYKDKGYPLTTEWSISVADNDAYNDALRLECRSRGTDKAEELVKQRGSPRWKGTIECKFKKYNPTDLIEFTSTRLGINKVKLRINRVNYNIQNQGGFVTLNVEEDEIKRGAQ